MQLWDAYAWETVAPHIPQCCRDFFFPRKCHLKHIYNWTQQRLWNWTGTAHLFEFFGKHFAGFFVFCFFFVFDFLFLSHFASTFISPCNFNALDEECIISHTSFFLKKKKTSFCIKRYICHISPCSTVFKTICQKYSNTRLALVSLAYTAFHVFRPPFVTGTVSCNKSYQRLNLGSP